MRWPTAYEWAPAAKWVDGLRAGLSARVPVSAGEIDQPYEGAVLIECALIFKMQYRVVGYEGARVVPGGYVPARPHLDRYLPALRHLSDRSDPLYDVYGRFGLSYATEYRRAAVEALQAQRRFAYEGSLKILPYAAYLREAARSRVCLDLPGNGDMCHRLIEYLAIGCCVVRPEPLHPPTAGADRWRQHPLRPERPLGPHRRVRRAGRRSGPLPGDRARRPRLLRPPPAGRPAGRLLPRSLRSDPRARLTP